MEAYTMFMDGWLNIVKMSIIYKVISSFRAILIKIPADVWVLGVDVDF